MSRERERPTVARERSSVAVVQGDVAPVGSSAVPVEGREVADRFELPDFPELPDLPPDPLPERPPSMEEVEQAANPFAIGCRLCQLGTVVWVRVASTRRGMSEIRAFCLFCNRMLDPHEVEPLPG